MHSFTSEPYLLLTINAAELTLQFKRCGKHFLKHR